MSVAISGSQAAAETAAARLKAAGIDAFLREADSAGEPGGTLDVVVMVPSSQQAAAHDLLRQAVAGDTPQEADFDFSESIAAEHVPAESLAAGLDQIRLRRSMMWFWFFSYIPAALLVTMKAPETSIPFVSLLWLTAYLVAGALAATSRCPRCHRRFCSDGRRWSFYTQRCLNCQLPLRGPAVENEVKRGT